MDTGRWSAGLGAPWLCESCAYSVLLLMHLSLPGRTPHCLPDRDELGLPTRMCAQAFAAAKGERPPSAPPALPRASREEMEAAAASYQEPSPPPSPRLSGGGAGGVADLPHVGPTSPPTNRNR